MVRVPSNDKSCSTPSPPPFDQRAYTPPSPDMGTGRITNSEDSPPLSPVRSPTGSPTTEKLGVRFMNARGSVDKEGGRNGRTAVYRPLFSSTELSTIDLKWGRLFDADLNPTPRLGQIFRGIANRLVSLSLSHYHTNPTPLPPMALKVLDVIAPLLENSRAQILQRLRDWAPFS